MFFKQTYNDVLKYNSEFKLLPFGILTKIIEVYSKEILDLSIIDF